MKERRSKITISILELYLEGKSNKEISEIVNKSEEYIMLLLNRYGFKSNRKFIEIDRNKIEQLLIGSYLGDGCFLKSGSIGSESRFQINHSIKQKEYFLEKFNILKECGIVKNYHIREFKSKLGKDCIEYKFRTSPHPIFSEYRKLGYDESKEYINLDLIKNINEIGFSYWFLDDSSVTNHSAIINCKAISIKQRKELIEIIKTNLNLNLTICTDGLYIPTNQMTRLIEIVYPNCNDFLKYKLVPYFHRGSIKIPLNGEHPYFIKIRTIPC